LSFSFLRFLPFWIGEIGGRECDIAVLSGIGLKLMYANWLLDFLLDGDFTNDDDQDRLNLVPLSYIICVWIGEDSALLEKKDELNRWLGINISALIRERVLRETAFLPYRNIWTKLAVAMLPLRVLLTSADATRYELRFRKFIGHYQMMDEYVDLFGDLASGAPNQLRRLLRVSEAKDITRSFWLKYARHGRSLGRGFRYDAVCFEGWGFYSLAEFCRSRASIVEEKAMFAGTVVCSMDDIFCQIPFG
jgi:hypothetical protein